MTPDAAAAAVAGFRAEIESGAADRVHEAGLLLSVITGGAITAIDHTIPTLRTAARHHIGSVRTTNEDLAHGDGRLAVVADGLGGHLRGDEASAAAVAALLRASATGPGLDALNAGMREADAAVTALARGDERPMTTLTALLPAAGPRPAPRRTRQRRGRGRRRGGVVARSPVIPTGATWCIRRPA
jgi:hypothetical protein